MFIQEKFIYVQDYFGCMDKKKVVGVIVLVLVGVFLYINYSKEDLSKPENWVEDKTDGIKEINLEKVTGGNAYSLGTGEQFNDGIISTVFIHEGWYNGEYFTNEYKKDATVILRVNQEMNPNDGIIEAYIAEDIKEGRIFAYVFVDEDWKEAIGDDTNILWGSNHQNIKEFVFNEISKGIYMDQIEDDRSRFNEDFSESKGGVSVGSLTLKNVEEENISNVIFVMVT